MFIRTPYNYDQKVISLKTGLSCPEPSLAKQEFRDECDINRIMFQYARTGEIPQVSGAVYGDFSSTQSYHDMQNTIKEAEKAFKTLPASIRASFNNNPAEVIDFLNNPANREKAVQLGLVNGQITAEVLDSQGQKETPKGENP